MFWFTSSTFNSERTIHGIYSLNFVPRFSNISYNGFRNRRPTRGCIRNNCYAFTLFFGPLADSSPNHKILNYEHFFLSLQFRFQPTLGSQLCLDFFFFFVGVVVEGGLRLSTVDSYKCTIINLNKTRAVLHSTYIYRRFTTKKEGRLTIHCVLQESFSHI